MGSICSSAENKISNLEKGGKGGTPDFGNILKDVLKEGSEFASKELSKDGAFSKSDKLKIPLPPQLEKLRKPLAAAGKESELDDLQNEMNTAAERACKDSGDVVKSTIDGMNVADAQKMLADKDPKCGTNYLKEKAGSEVEKNMRAHVDKAIDESDLQAKLQKVLEAAKDKGFFGKMKDSISDLTGGKSDTLADKAEEKLEDEEKLDISKYVSEKATDAFFNLIGDKEEELRKNPDKAAGALKGVLGKVLSAPAGSSEATPLTS